MRGEQASLKGEKIIQPRTIRAHFDGEQVCLDESCQLEPDAQLLVVVLPKQSSDHEHEDWLLLSRQALENACGEDEPEYSLDAIKEPNPEDERRGRRPDANSPSRWESEEPPSNRPSRNAWLWGCPRLWCEHSIVL